MDYKIYQDLLQSDIHYLQSGAGFASLTELGAWILALECVL